MLEYILLLLALLGTLIAAVYDLKTSEIPDWVPLLIGILGISYSFMHGLLSTDFTLFYSSVLSGSALLFIGYILYLLGQWGEGDTLVFGSVGFLIPQSLSIFPQAQFFIGYQLHFVANVFIIGAIYSLVYALIIAVFRGGIFSRFFDDIRKNCKKICLIFGAYIVFYIFAAFLSHTIYNAPYQMIFRSTLLVFVLPFVFLPMIRFAKIIDTCAFRKKIPVSKLQEGDVLAEDIDEIGLSSKYFIGLEKKDIKNIASIKSEVCIKDGIRFAPTFFLALLFTWKFGSIMTIIITLF